MTQPDDNSRALTWIGHSTILLELGAVRLLTDPVLGRRVGFLRRLAPPVPSPGAVDAVLVSHLHGDHVDLRSLRALGHGPIVAAPAAAAWLRRRGFADARELAPGSAVDINGVSVEATPASHDGRRWPRGPAVGAVGFVAGGIYFAGDTDLFPEMKSLAGRVDVALVPVWGWGPTLGPGHLNPESAAEAVAAIRPHLAIPIHWGTLGLPWARASRERLAAPATRFATAVERVAPDVEVRVLEPGERTVVHAPPPDAGARGRA